MTTPELINELRQIAAGSEWDFPITWSARITEAAARLEELEAIVSRTLTTIDGSPIFEHMTVYRQTKTTGKVEPLTVYSYFRAQSTKPFLDFDATGCYSTKAAALAAREKNK